MATVPVFATLCAQDPAAPSAPPADTLEVFTRLVQLDVVALDRKGRPFEGLAAGDFTLLEDGVPETITGFQAHQQRSDPAPPPLALPPNTFTNYVPGIAPDATPTVIVMYGPSMFPQTAYVYEEVLGYLKHASPGNPMAIFVFDLYPNLFGSGLHLLQGFTSDPAVLVNAMNSKRQMPSMGGTHDDTRYQYFQQSYLYQGTAGLARYLAGIPGRKNLILFTGFSAGSMSQDLPDTTSFVDDLVRSTDILSLSRVAVYLIDSAGVTIGPRAYTGDVYNSITAGTGGKSFYSTNGMKEAIREVVERGKVYYTLSYKPSAGKWDGKYRRITLTTRRPDLQLEYRDGYLATDRGALERKHMAEKRLPGHSTQTGNFQPVSEAEAPVSAGLRRRDAADPVKSPEQIFNAHLQSAMMPGTLPATEVLFVASITPASATGKLPKHSPLPAGNYLRPVFLGKSLRDYTLLYAARMDSIHLSQSADGVRHGKVDFVAVVYGDGGQIVNSLLTTETLDVSEVQYQRLLRSGLFMVQHMAVPAKGNYFLRLGMGDALGDHVGAMEIPVDQVKLKIAGVSLASNP